MASFWNIQRRWNYRPIIRGLLSLIGIVFLFSPVGEGFCKHYSGNERELLYTIGDIYVIKTAYGLHAYNVLRGMGDIIGDLSGYIEQFEVEEGMGDEVEEIKGMGAYRGIKGGRYIPLRADPHRHIYERRDRRGIIKAQRALFWIVRELKRNRKSLKKRDTQINEEKISHTLEEKINPIELSFLQSPSTEEERRTIRYF